jgi:hypothetical protein
MKSNDRKAYKCFSCGHLHQRMVCPACGQVNLDAMPGCEQIKRDLIAMREKKRGG